MRRIIQHVHQTQRREDLKQIEAGCNTIASIYHMQEQLNVTDAHFNQVLVKSSGIQYVFTQKPRVAEAFFNHASTFTSREELVDELKPHMIDLNLFKAGVSDLENRLQRRRDVRSDRIDERDI